MRGSGLSRVLPWYLDDTWEMTSWFMCTEWFPKHHSFASLWLLMSIQDPWTLMAMITAAEISSSTCTRKSSSFSPALPCTPQFSMDPLCSLRVGGKKGKLCTLCPTVFRDLSMHVLSPFSGTSGEILLSLLSWGGGAQGPPRPSTAERRGCLWRQ